MTDVHHMIHHDRSKLVLHEHLKLGKVEPKREVKVKLTDFADVKHLAKKLPAGDFGAWGQVKDWGMYANDRLGCCVVARAAHMHDLFNREHGGTGLLFDDASVEAMYSAVTGWSPDKPDSDQGTDPEAMAAYHRKSGFKDKNGKVHFIGAYCQLEPGNWQEKLVADYFLEATSTCMVFKSWMMDQFRNHQPWDYKRGGTTEGGHDTLGCGRNGVNGQVITWGVDQPYTRKWYEHMSDMALGYVSTEMLNGQGKTVEGIDVKALNDVLAAVTKH